MVLRLSITDCGQMFQYQLMGFSRVAHNTAAEYPRDQERVSKPHSSDTVITLIHGGARR